MVGTVIVFSPATPFFLFMHAKDITVPKGHELSVYSIGAVTLKASAAISRHALWKQSPPEPPQKSQ